MRLWLLERPDDLPCDYDESHSFVVAAETEGLARATVPHDPNNVHDNWIPNDRVVVVPLGVADAGIDPGVVLESFMAG